MIWRLCPADCSSARGLPLQQRFAALKAGQFPRTRVEAVDEIGDWWCRDLDDVGGTDINVVALNKLPYGSITERVPQGVVFLTYSSLISSSDKVQLAPLLGYISSARTTITTPAQLAPVI